LSTLSEKPVGFLQIGNTTEGVKMKPDKDLIIVGAGAAGMTAAQYAARANLNVLLLEELSPGGQAILIDDLENYPGFLEPIKGYDFSMRMEEQAKKFGAEISYAMVEKINKEGNLFQVQTNEGLLVSKAVIIATGSKHRHLGIPGEEEFRGKGVSYCATCDGPFFKNRRIFVSGGGDAACDEAMYLSKLTSTVIMVHRRDRFRAQKALAARVLSNPHITVLFNTEIREIQGDKAVNRVRLYNNLDQREYEEEAGAVFVFIGSIPQTAMLTNGSLDVKLDDAGYIPTDQRMETNIRGLFAAGDVRATPFRQLITAAGEGAIAAHCAAQHIDELEGKAYL